MDPRPIIPADFRLRRHPGRFAICRLPPREPVPPWVDVEAWREGGGAIVCVVRTATELSILLPAERVPAEVDAQRHLVALSVEGRIDFEVIGLLARLSAAVAASGAPLLALSTFDTDWLLIREPDVIAALAAIRAAGFRVIE